MAIVRTIVSIITSIALAIAFVGAGFAVCTLPPITHVLANSFSDDATSPFSRSQLVQVADATRDYSFGNHSISDLYQAIYEVDAQYAQQIKSGGGILPAGFPKLDAVSGASNSEQLASAFASASEMYCYSPETISHLDDCHAIATVAYPAVIAAALIGVVGLVATGVMGRRRQVGAVLLAAGIAVLVVIVALGVWAAIDFNGFFAAFHGLFFSQGNWVFPYDSLLICSLPTSFWVGMGVVWLVTSVLASILSIIVGGKCRKGNQKGHRKG